MKKAAVLIRASVGGDADQNGGFAWAPCNGRNIVGPASATQNMKARSVPNLGKYFFSLFSDT
jgi:hypothetical protein